ncbi:hypothetical protein CN198_13940 [Sinorhizobium meliloti]|uniref:hypothetical protein n=1 Tax=Rhizobium meliloti TaxID=382 RepID=UPI000FDBF9B4|nr:hypothetical protein [Sinorhizobium meliloti]RVH69163.1 hypothetical protein CN198_13940 [Sinorhizobium meliloti]
MKAFFFISLAVGFLCADGVLAQETTDPSLQNAAVYSKPDCQYSIPGFTPVGMHRVGAIPTRLPNGPNPSFYVPLVTTRVVRDGPNRWLLLIGPAPESMAVQGNPTEQTFNANIRWNEDHWLPQNSIPTYPAAIVDCFVTSLGTRMIAQDLAQATLATSIITRQQVSDAALTRMIEEKALELTARLEQLERRLTEIQRGLRQAQTPQ